MKFKSFFIVLLFLLIIVMQLALEGSFIFFSGKVNLILIAVIIFMNFLNFNWIILFVLLAGWLMDIYSGLPFGLIILSLLLSAVVCQLLFVNFFTNLSLYSSLVLGSVAVLFYNLCLTGFLLIFYSLGLTDFTVDLNYVGKIIFQLLFNTLIMLAAYWLINKLSKRLKPIFLK